MLYVASEIGTHGEVYYIPGGTHVLYTAVSSPAQFPININGLPLLDLKQDYHFSIVIGNIRGRSLN